jgi:putative transcriptional regulator
MMRFTPDRGQGQDALQLAGSLLLAHPSLRDSNFQRTVVLLAAHSADDGALGVIVNRPLEQTLSEYDAELCGSALADVPLYEGGPVASDQIILVAWKWSRADGTFRLYFGIDEIKARQMLESTPEFEVRAFLGHAGWGEGQLEAEIEVDSWVLAALSPEFDARQGRSVWRSMLSAVSPEMQLLAEEPDDLSMN